MTVAVPSANRAPHPSSLADVLDLVLDKGIVIDAYVRVSLVGIELVTIDARVVIASVDTYLRFAEAVNRLDIQPQQQPEGLPGLIKDMQEGGAEHKTRGALRGVRDTAHELVSNVRGDDDEQRRGTNGRRRPRDDASGERRHATARRPARPRDREG